MNEFVTPKGHPAEDYIDGVLSGDIPACQSIIQGVQRACLDHQYAPERGFFYDAEAAEYMIEYTKLCKHTKGQWAGTPFIMAPWQRFVAGELFGWKYKETGFRRFNLAFIEIPKKNGKSTFLATIGIYMLHGDGEPGAEIFALASQRDQAKIVFNQAKAMVRRSSDLRREIAVYQHHMYITEADAVFEPLASDVDTVDGRNPHANIVDELHRHKSRYLWDLVENTMVARTQPLSVAITTAGDDLTGVCYEQHNYALGILEGNYKNDNYFCYVATPEEGYDWKDETQWRKLNPNMGISVDINEMRRTFKKAHAITAQSSAFRRYRLNEWTNEAGRWLSMEYWHKCKGEIDLDQLKGMSCWGGLDLALTFDMTAFVLVFEAHELTYVVPKYYVPEDNLVYRSEHDKLPYDAWRDDGYLIATPGNVTDMEFVKRDILDAAEKYQLQGLGYDPYKATQLAVQLQDEGVPMVEMRQGPMTLNEPMLQLEARIMNRTLVHTDHPILNWNASNVVTRSNVQGAMAPDRAKSREKIDGIVALIMAIGRQIADHNTGPQMSIYATESPLVVNIG